MRSTVTSQPELAQSILSPIEFFFSGTLAEGTNWSSAIVVVEILARLTLACIVVVRKGSRPSVATAWLLVVVSFPLIGSIAYLMLGESRLGGRRRTLHRMILDRFDRPDFHRHDDPRAQDVRMDPSDLQIAHIARRVSNSPATAGNRARLVGDSKSSVEQIVVDIDQATSTVHLVTYIWLNDRVGEQLASALIAAAKRGVACRVLADGHGSSKFLKSSLCHSMRAGGVRIVAALPTHPFRALFHRIDVRNHRKIIVVDCDVGWVGSMNVAAPEFAVQPRFAPWVDCMVRLNGPAVRELQLIFVEDWYLDTNESLMELLHHMPPFHEDGIPAQIMASGPNYDNDAVRSLLMAAIQLARIEIVLTTPYFVPDSDMFSALCVAAQRGVEVHLVVPQRNNSWLVGLASRARYGALLAAGIHIHEFTRGLLHAKTVTVDSLFAIVTSSNLDRRSFEINFEASAIMFDDGFAREVRSLQQEYIGFSVDVTTDSWGTQSLPRRLAQNSASLISPLI